MAVNSFANIDYTIAVPSSEMTLLSTTTMSGSANIEVTSINQTYRDLFVEVYNMTWGTGNAQIYIDINSDIFGSSANWISNTTVGLVQTNAVTLSGGNITNNTGNYYGMTINGYSSTAAYKSFNWSGGSYYTTVYAMQGAGVYMATAAITSIKIRNNGPYSFTGGTMRIWGIK
jgi:hypothetical protein